MKHKLPSLAKARWGAIFIVLLLFVGPVALKPSIVTAENINKNKSLETDVMVVEETAAKPVVKKTQAKPTINLNHTNDQQVTATGSRGLVQKYAAQYGVDWKLVEAIVLHETGNRTSSAFRNKHNSCGMMKSGRLITFASEEAGVNSCVKNLKENYISKGLTSPESIGRKYAGSKTWASKIYHYYNKL